MNKEFIEIRWHGRGGQGAITAAKIVAEAAFISGYAGVVMAPTFGTERRGAPVMTSLKISREKIYDLSPIETPDIVVVLDHLLHGQHRNLFCCAVHGRLAGMMTVRPVLEHGRHELEVQWLATARGGPTGKPARGEWVHKGAGAMLLAGASPRASFTSRISGR